MPLSFVLSRRLVTLAALAAIAATTAGLPQAASAAAVAPPSDLSSWAATGSTGGSGADGDITLSPFGNARYGYVSTADSTRLGISPLQLDANSRGNGTENNGSRLVSGAFSAAAGDTLALRFNYISTDGKGFDDYAWARLLNANDNSLVAWLFTARSSNSNTKGIVPGDVVDKDEFDPDEVIVDYKDFDFHSKTAVDQVNWSKLGGSNRTCWEDNAAGCGYTGWLLSQHSFASGGSYRLEIGVVNWGDEAYDSGLAFDFAGLSAPVPEPASGLLLAAGLAALGWRARRAQ